MKKPRDLSNALDPDALSFLKGNTTPEIQETEEGENSTPTGNDSQPSNEFPQNRSEATNHQAREPRVTFNIRVPEGISKALMKTSFDRRLAGETPATLQDIGTEALREWLERRDLLL
ncbi:MAG: hypothetical protein AAGA96_20055 [Verrucomicrobiota bacterium]